MNKKEREERNSDITPLTHSLVVNAHFTDVYSIRDDSIVVVVFCMCVLLTFAHPFLCLPLSLSPSPSPSLCPHLLLFLIHLHVPFVDTGWESLFALKVCVCVCAWQCLDTSTCFPFLSLFFPSLCLPSSSLSFLPSLPPFPPPYPSTPSSLLSFNSLTQLTFSLAYTHNRLHSYDLILLHSFAQFTSITTTTPSTTLPTHPSYSLTTTITLPTNILIENNSFGFTHSHLPPVNTTR